MRLTGRINAGNSECPARRRGIQRTHARSQPSRSGASGHAVAYGRLIESRLARYRATAGLHLRSQMTGVRSGATAADTLLSFRLGSLTSLAKLRKMSTGLAVSAHGFDKRDRLGRHVAHARVDSNQQPDSPVTRQKCRSVRPVPDRDVPARESGPPGATSGLLGSERPPLAGP